MHLFIFLFLQTTRVYTLGQCGAREKRLADADGECGRFQARRSIETAPITM
jgi:hypothetical protein